ncbi:MAG: NifU family protein [Bacilli bacterium]|nr:NifU family protein [Mollicutes bacterium]MDY3899836.1 NifU family protein [Bacilli bacterium]
MTDAEIIKLVKKTLKKVRPYLQADGGDVDFIKVEDGIVYVRLLGACIGCASSDETIKGGIEALLLEEVPGVIGVEQVEDGE